MLIKIKSLKVILTLLMLFCISITPIILAEEVSAAKSYEYQVLDLVNEERAKSGVAPLKMDKDLFDAAKIRSKEIQIVFSHDRPDGSSCFTVSSKASGENIAKGQSTPQIVMNSWMNSAGHRANILDSSFKSIGIGYLQGTYSCWVQLFGRGVADERLESDLITTTSYEIDNGDKQEPTKQEPKPPNNNNYKEQVKKPNPPSFTLSSDKKKITVKWKKVSKASGYEIHKSLKKNGKYVLEKRITKGSTIKYTDKKLKKKQKYYYKIRSYTTDKGKRIYSKFSSIKSKTTK